MVQVGKKANKSATCVQGADLTSGGVATVTPPSAPHARCRNYLALHLGNYYSGAEFYPACAQIKVGGTQISAPDPKELVSIPGIYSDNDPDVFDPSPPYTFPGPAIASFVGDTTGTGTGTLTSGNPTTTPTSSSNCQLCKVKKGSTTTSAAAVVRPRRIMRRFASIGDSRHH